MPTFQKGAVGPRPQPAGLHLLAGRRRRAARRSATARPTSSATRRSRTSSTVYDFHATILHLLGLDHERLSFYHNGIERRLTDVHGEVIHAMLSSVQPRGQAHELHGAR